MISGLVEGPTYYVKAYATNKIGTAYSISASSFKICKPTFTVQHIAGIDGAAETKKVTYNSISSNLTGKAACWLLQNLGADSVATSAIDATSKSAGWYWQFNRLQAYKYDAGTRTPNTTCSLLLGAGWRLPTYNEWYYADDAPQFWQNYNDTYKSVLKVHAAGYLAASNGAMTGRGSTGYYWSNSYVGSTYTDAYAFLSTSAGSSVVGLNKANATPIRCVRDGLIPALASVSDVSVPTYTMTGSSAT